MLPYAVDNLSGEDLGALLGELVDKRWSNGAVHQFSVHDQLIFEVRVSRTDQQPGNGRVLFAGKSPAWTVLLESILRRGFRASYAELSRGKLRDTYDATPPQVFAAFVMIQFEVVRRVTREDRFRFPSRAQVSEAVRRALQVDRKDVYKNLIGVFEGNQRVESCQMIQASLY